MSADLLTADSAQDASPMPRNDAYYRLKADMEDFLYAEADLLDNGSFATGWHSSPTTSPTSCRYGAT